MYRTYLKHMDTKKRSRGGHNLTFAVYINECIDNIEKMNLIMEHAVQEGEPIEQINDDIYMLTSNSKVCSLNI